jgi:hypothetical protein
LALLRSGAGRENDCDATQLQGRIKVPELFRARYTQAELMRRIGRLEQVAGVRLVTAGDGIERGVRMLEFRTGTGFSFDVLVDRAFDIGRCEMNGTPYGWMSPTGIVGPWFSEPEGMGWFRSFPGGLVSTAGLDHTLIGGEDSAAQFNQPHLKPTETYGMMGRVWTLPARLSGYGERWDGNDCILWAEGEVHQAAVFGENLTLRRRVEARVGESWFRIHDEVENTGHTRTTHMLLYHCNVGFPIVEEGAQLLVPGPGTPTDTLPAGNYRVLEAPIANYQERCFEHDVITEPDGTVPVGILNRRIGMGVYQLFNKGQLPHQTTWRMPGEDLYVVAIEASTNRDAGRWDARERGELIEMAPGEVRRYDLEMGALVGEAQLDSFAQRVARLDAGAVAQG